MMLELATGDFAHVLMAPAKINLALHVVGQRQDGYHILESLVTFADAGDRIGIRPADKDVFTVSGVFAGDVPLTDDNLVLKARDLLRAAGAERCHPAAPVHIHLEKNLPVASGIGGGSADAAATIKGLQAFWTMDIDPETLAGLALRLGADVPMCLASRPVLARGIGEALTPLPDFPGLSLLLLNPLVGVSTPAIFRLLHNKINPPLALPAGTPDAEGWIDHLASLRNDLEPPARMAEASISKVSDALGRSGARLVRMSGSGATCFGIYATAEDRDAAASALCAAHPNWYVLACDTI